MDWISALEKLAPTIASCLGTPVAGMAVAALESALGVTGQDNVQKVIENNKLNGEQVASIQQAEIALKAKAQELGLDFEQLSVADRSSARDMQAKVMSIMPPILASLIIGGFTALMIMKFSGVNVTTDPTMQDLFNTLRDAVMLVLYFYFGSSYGSQAKSATIHQIATKE